MRGQTLNYLESPNHNLQKEVLWALFEEKVVTTENKKEKHRLNQ